MEKCKNFGFDRTFIDLLLQTVLNRTLDIDTSSHWVCVIKVCSNLGAIYNIIIAIVDDLNVANLMKKLKKNLLLFSSKPLNGIFRYWIQLVPL